MLRQSPVDKAPFHSIATWSGLDPIAVPELALQQWLSIGRHEHLVNGIYVVTLGDATEIAPKLDATLSTWFHIRAKQESCGDTIARQARALTMMLETVASVFGDDTGVGTELVNTQSRKGFAELS